MTKKPAKPAAKSRQSPRSSSKPGSASGTRAHTGAKRAPRAGKRTARAPKPAAAAKRSTRGQQTLIMLKRSKGVSLDEMVAAFGVQKHTARALVSVYGRLAGGVERSERRYYLNIRRARRAG